MKIKFAFTRKKRKGQKGFKNLKQMAGFTIVELLLYMALFTGFMTILSGLFISTLETQLDASANSKTSQDSWYLFSRLGYDMYRATSITNPATNGETTTTLTFENDTATVTYSLVGGKIVITEDGVTTPIISENVTATNLNFNRLGAQDGKSTISVHFELQGGADQPVQTVEFTLGQR